VGGLDRSVGGQVVFRRRFDVSVADDGWGEAGNTVGTDGAPPHTDIFLSLFELINREKIFNSATSPRQQ
jgi:hypothetical protein